MTSLGTKDRVVFGSGGGLSTAMILTGGFLLAFGAMVVGVMIAADYREKGMGPPLIFLFGFAFAALIAGVVPRFRGRRTVDFVAGEIRTPGERVPLWQVRSVTVSSHVVEVPLSGIRRGGSGLVAGSPMELQEWQLGVIASESEIDADGVDNRLRGELLTSGRSVVLNKSSDHPRLLREARDLARRLDVPMVDSTDPNRPVIVPAGSGTGSFEEAVAVGGPPPLLEDAPDGINAGIENDCVVIRNKGVEVMVAIGLAIVAVVSLTFFIAEYGLFVIPPWSEIEIELRLAGVGGIVLTFAALFFLVLVLGGHHRKTLRVGPSGIQRSTDFRWSRDTTIPLDDIIDVQKIVVTNRSGRSTTTSHSVDVIGEKQKFRHACDDEEAATWLQDQLRAAIAHFRPG